MHIEGLEELDDSEEIDSHLEIIFEDNEEAGQVNSGNITHSDSNNFI